MPTTAVYSEKKPLTPMQRAFVGEFLIDLNASQAAKRAGYSGKGGAIGWQLCMVPKIKTAINEAMAKLAERTELKQDTVIGELLVMARKPGAKDADRIRCWELIGKHIGMFNTVVVQGDPDKPIMHAEMSADDAARIVAFTLAKGAQAVADASESKTSH